MTAHPSDVKVNVKSPGGNKGVPLSTATSNATASKLLLQTVVPDFHPCSKLHGLTSPCARRMWLEFIVSGKVPIASNKRCHVPGKNKKQKALQSWNIGITVATHERRRLHRKCGGADWYSTISYSTPSKRRCLDSSPKSAEVMNCKSPGSIRRYQAVATSTSSYSTPSKTRSSNTNVVDPTVLK